MAQTFNPRPTLADMENMDLPDIDFSAIDEDDPLSLFRAIGAGSGSGYVPMPDMISAGEVRTQARAKSDKIFDDWKLLGDILDRHEERLHKRWAKKTKKQRVEILLSAWPKMSQHHRPDFAAFRKESESQREAGTKFKEAFMWPYMNLEDLSKPRILPLFLNARATNTPDAFAFTDIEATRLGHVTKAIVPVFLNLHTMMFTDRKTPQKYGQLISWDEHDKAADWLFSGKGIHPGDGLIVLEIQQRVMSFLVECCRRIMHETSPQKLTSDEFPIQAPPALPAATEDGFASLAVLALEAPYRPPAQLDFPRIESLIAAKLSAAEDHIWALREDPGYFKYALLEYKEHRQEMIKDTMGQEHHLFKLHREEVFWHRAELLLQVQTLQRLRAKYVHKIIPSEHLHDEYLYAILKLRHYLEKASKELLDQLKHVGFASPPLRPWFARRPPPVTTTIMIGVVSKPNLKLSQVESELLWLMKTLWEDGSNLFLAGLPEVVDELQRLTQSSQEAKNLMSSYVSGIIGDLAVITETLKQLNTYQPWAHSFEYLLVDHKEEIEQGYDKVRKQWGCLRNVMIGPDKMRITRLGDPSETSFDYPVDKPLNKKNVVTMRTAESNLDDFWRAVDYDMNTRSGSALNGTVLKRLLSQKRVLRRTPEWIDQPAKQTELTSNGNVASTLKPLYELYFDLEYRTKHTAGELKEQVPPTKTKTKTRSNARVQERDEAPAVAPPPSSLPDVQPTFHVDARALKVFRTLFYIPSQHSTPGEIAWTDFLHAMVTVGFIPEKLYGSVWHFQPTRLDVERSIQFHEPHPIAKLPYWIARRFGRRLERAYGWFGGMFELASCNKAQSMLAD